MSSMTVDIGDVGHLNIVTPDGRIIITRYPGIGTGVAVYLIDHEPIAIINVPLRDTKETS